MSSGPVRRHTLITLFREAARAMVEELIERLNDAGHPGMRPAYSQVMENIDRGGTRITVLAARAGLSHPSMIELVAAMEGLGYVERVPDPGDGRARLVRLTPAGRALQRQALVEIADIEQAWLARFEDLGGPSLKDRLVALAEARREPLGAGRDPGRHPPA